MREPREIRMVVAAVPIKLLIRSPLAPDCDFELRVHRDINSEEWDVLFEYLKVCHGSADRKAVAQEPEGERL